MKQAVLVFAIALVITLAIGPAVINYLRKMKFGQKILEIGPKWHMNKQNIPTMGGFMFIIGIAAAVIIGNIVMGEISVSSLAVLGLAVAYGAVGLVDDYAKIKKKENAGLTPKQKLVLQILVAGVFILVLFLGSSGLPQLWIPFTGISFSWPWPLYIVFAAFVIVGADNAVNLTDGIDGLAASVTLPVAIFFVFVGFRRGDMGVVIFSAALAGALLGFLRYNFNPAKVFMGDTGSTFLGYILATLSITGLFKMYAIISFAVPFLILGIPIFDICFAFLRRIAHGQNPMKADRGHFHHRLIDMGFSQKQSVAIAYMLTGMLGLAAVLLTSSGELKALILIAAIFIVSAIGFRLIFSKNDPAEDASSPEPEEKQEEPHE